MITQEEICRKYVSTSSRSRPFHRIVIHQSDMLTAHLGNLFPQHCLPAQGLRQTPHRAAARPIIGYAAMAYSLMCLEWDLLQCHFDCLAEILPRSAPEAFQLAYHRSFQIAVLQPCYHLDHCQTACPAPASAMALHPVGVYPVVALACPDSLQSFFQARPQPERSDIIPASLQVCPQFCHIFHIFCIFCFAF